MVAGLLALLLWSLPLAEVTAPLVGRPSAAFYGAVGQKVHVTLAVSRSELQVEEETTFTIRIQGALNSAQLQRPDLRELDDYAAAFHIDDLDDGPEQPVMERYFRYRLRPKHERVLEIPALLYRYFQPDLGYFATTVAEAALPLSVAPRNGAVHAAVPLEAPEFLFAIDSNASVLSTSQSRAAWPWLVVAWLGPLGLCGGWYVWWRWRYPGGAKLARLRRHRAVRQVLDVLAAPGDADAVVAAMHAYLQQRLDLPWQLQTSDAILEFLLTRNVAAHVRCQAERFFRACDATRFGPPGATHTNVFALGRELVLFVEEAP